MGILGVRCTDFRLSDNISYLEGMHWGLLNHGVIVASSASEENLTWKKGRTISCIICFRISGWGLVGPWYIFDQTTFGIIADTRSEVVDSAVYT